MTWKKLAGGDLEREYSPSSCIPDIEVELDQYVAASDQARQLLNPSTHRYGAGENDILDAYGIGDRRPALIFFHGGYWQELSKAESSFMAPGLCDGGIACIVPEYTLAPVSTLSAIVDQCVTAVEWIAGHADELDIDREHLVLAGSSAGAQLAAMVLTRSNVAAGAVLLSGIYELEPVRHTSINAALGLTTESAALNSPLTLAPLRTVPVVVGFGGIETSEFVRQSRAFAAAWSTRTTVTLLEHPNRNHFDLPFDLANPATLIGAATRRLLRSGLDDRPL